MILYFSGSGNSEFVATKIAKGTNDSLISINEILKEEKVTEFNSNVPYVFVLPVYAGRMPRVVEKCIKNMKFNGNKKAYFIMTCFETPYDSMKSITKLCREINMSLVGFDYVNMPQCYIAMYDVPTHEQAMQIYKDALGKIDVISSSIEKQETFYNETKGMMMSTVVNPIFCSMMVSAKGFYTTDKCLKCGQCIKRCPLNNISTVDNQITWGKNCTHCMACINGCSRQAIEYKKSTQGKTRNYYIGKELLK